MNNETAMTIILLMGVGFGLFAKFLLDNVVANVNQIKALLENNRKFKAKQAEVDKMKAAGDMHEWVSVPTVKGTLLMCKKTGWCPTLQGFIPLSHINGYLEQVKADEEYKIYRNARVQQLAHQLSLSIPTMESVVESVFSIKKDFHLERLSRLQQEMAKKAVVNGTKEI